MRKFGILLAKKEDLPDGSGDKAPKKGAKAAPAKVEDIDTEEDEEEEDDDEEAGTEEDKDEEDKDEDDETDETEDDEETLGKDDLTFIRALRNPRTSKAVIAQLAREAGLQISEAPAGDKAKVRGAWKEALRAKVGDNLFNAMAPAFQEAIAEMLEPIVEQNRAMAEAQIHRDSKRAYHEFSASNPEAHRFEREMTALMDSYPPGDTVEPLDYLQDIFTLAKARHPKKAKAVTDDTDGERSKRIEHGKKVAKMPNSGDRAPGGKIQAGGPKKATLAEAVSAGFEGRQLG